MKSFVYEVAGNVLSILKFHTIPILVIYESNLLDQAVRLAMVVSNNV